MIRTAVAIFIFNRPETTQHVFERIRQARPTLLLVVADGPRLGEPGDAELCFAARKITETIDWPCEVIRNYSDYNMGCRERVSSGLDWVFSMVPEAIILEDDCLPDPSFFRFCNELLEVYRDDERIALISGVNYQFGRKRSQYSYYFSRYNHIWGWASWRRAWRNYDVEMKAWPEVQMGNWLEDILGNNRMARYWKYNFEKACKGSIDTWDFQWTFSCWINNQLSILPNVNLVSNIGFNENATHTIEQGTKIANMRSEEMSFPLKHPSLFIRDTKADEFTEKILYRCGKLEYVRNIINSIRRQC